MVTAATVNTRRRHSEGQVREPNIEARRVALEKAYEICGTAKATSELMRAPIPEFGGASLNDLCDRGRLDAALAYLESIEHGSTG